MESLNSLTLADVESAEPLNNVSQFSPSRMTAGIAGSFDLIDATTGQIHRAELFLATLKGSGGAYSQVLVDHNIWSWIGAHINALEFFKGAPDHICCVQLRGGITRSCLRNPADSKSYTEMANYFGASITSISKAALTSDCDWIRAARVLMANVSANVANASPRSLPEMDSWIAQLKLELDYSPEQLLRPLPSAQYEIALWKECGVGIDYHVEFETNFYSVPYHLRSQRLWLRSTADAVEFYCKVSQVKVASHARTYRRRAYTTLADHMPSHRQVTEVEWTPDQMLWEAQSVGGSTTCMIERLLSSKKFPEQAFRSCLGILKLCERYGAARVEAAAERAISLDWYSLAAIRRVLDIGSEAAFLKTSDETATT